MAPHPHRSGRTEHFRALYQGKLYRVFLPDKGDPYTWALMNPEKKPRVIYGYVFKDVADRGQCHVMPSASTEEWADAYFVRTDDGTYDATLQTRSIKCQ